MEGSHTTGIQTACFGQNLAVSATLPQILSAPWLALHVPTDDAESSCTPGCGAAAAHSLCWLMFKVTTATVHGFG